MPKLGAYTEDVLLAGWLVGEGQHVPAGGLVFELETEKTTAEVEADVGGFVHQFVPAGDSVPIGTTVGMIAETIEEYTVLASGANGASAEAEALRRDAPLVSPRARVLLRELGYTLDDAREIAGSGPGGPDRRPRRHGLGRDPSGRPCRSRREGSRSPARSRCAGGAGRSPRGCSRACTSRRS